MQLQAGLGAHVVCREQPQLDELRRAPLVATQALGRRLLRRHLRQQRRRRLGRARVGAAPAAVDEHVAAAALSIAAAALVVAGRATTRRIPERVRRRRLHTRVVELEPLVGAPRALGASGGLGPPRVARRLAQQCGVVAARARPGV